MSTAIRTPSRAHRLVGLYLPLIVTSIAMARVWVFTIDDAYISYRYARNLSRGWGLVYNYGERVEGYTNFLWTVLLAGVHAVGIDLDVGAKLLGALATLASIWLVYVLALRVRRFTRVPCLATWALATSQIFTGYGVFGLETSLFSALVLAGSLLFLLEEDRARAKIASSGWRAIPWSGVVFGLAGLTRPEAPLYLGLWMLLQTGPRLVGAKATGRATPRPGVRASGLLGDPRLALVGILAACAWLFVAYLHVGQTAVGPRVGFGLVALGMAGALVLRLPRQLLSPRNLLRGGIFVAIMGGHVLWRRSYYGMWVPNTLVAKTGDAARQLAMGWQYVGSFLSHESGMLLLAASGVAAVILWRHAELLYACALCALMTAYVVIVGGDWMPLFRFFAPVMPFLALLVGVGTRALYERRDRFVSTGLSVLLVVLVLQRWRLGEADVDEVLNTHHAFWQKTAAPAADWFNERSERYGDDARGLIAMGDIGEVGYRTDFPVLDLLGLVDPVIARQPGGYTTKIGRGYIERFFERGPRYVLFVTQDVACKRPYHQGSKVIFYDYRFSRNYVVAHAITFGDSAWCIYEHRALVPPAESVPSADGN